MIKINKNYLDRFKRTRYDYLYQIKVGIYLTFDKDTLEYYGINMFYLADMKKVYKLEEDTLNNLISKGILEVED